MKRHEKVAGWVARLHCRSLGNGVPAARAQPVNTS